MYFIKLIDIILIIIVCSYIGIDKSKKFSLRVRSLKNMKNSLNIFKSKIEFTYEPIIEIFQEISKVVYQNQENIFKNFCESLKFDDITECWNKAVVNTKDYLDSSDKEIIMILGKMLGKTNKEGQISEIELVNSFLNKQIEDAEEEKNKSEKLYKTLGIVSGLTIAIILV